ASRYNRLCDLEWNSPVGDADACGGESLIRAASFRDAGQFNATMIAGEEPELCVRLRQAGGKIFRLDENMSYHDAAITSFGQWWRRTERSGHAYAEGRSLHGKPPWKHSVKAVRSILVWGFWIPTMALGGLIAMYWLPWFGLLAAAGLLIYPVQVFRIYRDRLQRGNAPDEARLYAIFTMLGKWPQLKGALSFWLGRLFGKRRKLIEYK
ncbi:MAG: glycosyltransferase family 2 protein, partial [Planctomycetota bacterium]|nr:glycosyltransferase family 2 protein [Planctomycetota bacterium]